MIRALARLKGVAEHASAGWFLAALAELDISAMMREVRLRERGGAFREYVAAAEAMDAYFRAALRRSGAPQASSRA